MSSPFQKTFSGNKPFITPQTQSPDTIRVKKKPFITPQAQNPDTIRVNKKHNVGDYVPEDDIEGTFSQNGKNPNNYPQFSAQDYSKVKRDKKGNYIIKL